MRRPLFRLAVWAGILIAALVAPAIILDPMLPQGRALAQGGSEKEAFEAAKELGTVDAWNAFLANYSTGFHADLARAYLKKLQGEGAATAAPPASSQFDDFPVVAGSWGGIVRSGPGQDYDQVASLDEGEQVTLMARTDVMWNGYPWFKIAYGNDKRGYQWGGILCSAGPERPDVYKTCPQGAADKDEDEPKAKSSNASRTAEKECSSRSVLIDGKCIRKSAAAGYCGPGYRPQGGKCVPGYKAPPPNAPPSPAQRQGTQKGCPKGQVWSKAEGCHEDD